MLLWVAALSACASLSPAPDKGGPVWGRLESDHFVLLSDLESEAALDTIRLFERLLDGYTKLGWHTEGKLPVKLHVVVFEDRSDFDVFGSGLDGYHLRRVPFEPLVVMPRQGQLGDYAALKHELTHYIAFQSLPFQPRWFSEGLAGYFQTAYFDDADRFVVGSPPRELVRVLGSMGRVRAAELLSETSAELTPRFYATAWLLVHYFMSHQGEAFVKYQSGLANGLGHDAAWTDAFPDLPVTKVDELLERYYSIGQYPYLIQALPVYRGPEPRASVLAAADLYALRAQLFGSCQSCGEDGPRLARENIQQALRLEPRHLRASIMQLDSEPREKQLAHMKELSRAHPDAALAWFVLGTLELTSAGRCTPEVSSRLRELGRDSAHALMVAATCLAVAGEKQDALELSKRALRRQPADAQLLLMHAGVLVASGDCAGFQRVLLQLRNAADVQIDPADLAALEQCRSATPLQ